MNSKQFSRFTASILPCRAAAQKNPYLKQHGLDAAGGGTDLGARSFGFTGAGGDNILKGHVVRQQAV